MTRDEFMELVYETFDGEPDNVLANGIIQAADDYAESMLPEPCVDAISRQAAIDALDCINGAEEVLKALPPAKPEQKTGMWLIRKWGDNAKCSNCGHTFKDVYDMDNHDRFCRFCGSKMIGVKGETK